MSYVEQIEQQITAFPLTASLRVPRALGEVALPTHTSVATHVWDEDFCELCGPDGEILARFRLVN